MTSAVLHAAWPFPAADPYPAYHAARAEAPVQFSEELGAHLVLSHEHATAVLRNPEWSSDPRKSPRLLAAMGGQGPAADLLARSLLASDPPDHTRLRASVSGFFTPGAMQRIRHRVAGIVDTAIGPLADGEPIELMSEVAYPIGIAVIADLFDIGIEGAQLLRSEAPALVRMFDLDPDREVLEAAGAAAMALTLFLAPVIARRRREPAEDLLSALVHSPPGGAALEAYEILSLCLLLLAAGHETTANLIGNGTLALLEHRDELERLGRDPELTRSAVAELLRYDSPVQVVRRVARWDLSLGETHVREGDQALVVLGAANRDPARHLHPDRLDLTRTGSSSVAFGHGLHFCVGAVLARLEAEETFGRLAPLAAMCSADGWTHQRDDSRAFRRLRTLRIAPTA